MRPLRYSINIALDGSCEHRVPIPDEELHRHFASELERADALLLGRDLRDEGGGVAAAGDGVA